MRGSHELSAAAKSDVGIIPAGAGLTTKLPPCAVAVRDHPRRCGAHRRVADLMKGDTGSSPQVRGSLSAASARISCSGIIPAGAGLTIPCINKFKREGDHPRRCGAHDRDTPVTPVELGSSPQVRGSLHEVLLCLFRYGIIPAGAGLTVLYWIFPWQQGDHPRRCGAHQIRVHKDKLDLGSSPQVRGSPLARLPTRDASGIISAGAGLTVALKI